MKRKVRLRIISVLMTLVIITLSSNVVLAEKDDFKDVVNYYPYNSWAAEVGKKYNLIFLENNTRECKRYEIATILYYILDLKNVKNNIKFKDLDSLDNELKAKINAVTQANIISGYEDGTFKPDKNVTRAEFVTMLDRSGILNKIKKQKNITFLDVQNNWAKKSIEAIASIGILSGKGDDLFCPNEGITSQELLIIMDRMVMHGAITSDKLITSMQNTFKCKQYGEKERYIVEIIYNDFDRVQNFMNYAFPYKEYYDYKDWYKLATYEDIQIITYFMMSYNTVLLDTGDTREMFDNIGKTILEKKLSSGTNYTIRDFIHIIAALERVTDISMYGYGANTFTEAPVVKYTNKEDFIESDNEVFRIIIGNSDNTILKNIDMYFPFDVPITKYILNYFAMQLENSYNSYRKSLSYGITAFQDSRLEFEVDVNKLPSNYIDYPYIIKNISKELYEKSFMYTVREKIQSPIECYYNYSEVSRNIGSYAKIYYDAILNVDYRTIDEKKFADDVSLALYYIPEDDIKRYIQYVKDNEIIIQGKGAAVPGTLFMVDGYLFMKSIVEFKVISAKEMKNLLFGDLWNGLYNDVIYTQTEYEIYPDMAIYIGPYIYNGEFTSKSKLAYQPLFMGIYPKMEKYQLP